LKYKHNINKIKPEEKEKFKIKIKGYREYQLKDRCRSKTAVENSYKRRASRR
jgi:hypothetical protein